MTIDKRQKFCLMAKTKLFKIMSPLGTFAEDSEIEIKRHSYLIGLAQIFPLSFLFSLVSAYFFKYFNIWC